MYDMYLCMYVHVIYMYIHAERTPLKEQKKSKNQLSERESRVVTYGPHKAVAEVSNHNEPIGRKSGIQLVRKSMDFTFNCFVLNWLTD